MFPKIIILLVGIAAIAIGVKSIITRKTKFWSSEDADDQHVVEGFLAVLGGILEIAIGVYVLVSHRSPLPSLAN